MMDNPLLSVYRDPKFVREGAQALAVVVPVDPRLDAILTTNVSLKTPLYWYERPLGNGTVRAGVRPGQDLAAFFCLVIDAIVERGHELEYGNTHPFTLKGMEAAGDYVSSFGLRDIELLVSPLSGKRYLKRGTIGDYPVVGAEWVPEYTAVALPKERSFVGMVTLAGSSGMFAVVQNAVRGISVARKTPPRSLKKKSRKGKET